MHESYRRSIPHRHEPIFCGAHVRKFTFKHQPQAFTSHVQLFRTFENPQFVGPKTHCQGEVDIPPKSDGVESQNLCEFGDGATF